MTGSGFVSASLPAGLGAPVEPQADPRILAQIGSRVRQRLQANEAAIDRGGEKADLFVVPGFLSRRECKRLVRVIERKMGPSDLFSGTQIDGFRTSSTHFFERDDPETLELERKIDGLLGIDHRFAEVT